MEPQLAELADLDATVYSGEKRLDPSKHQFSVSTLVPGLHGQPIYRYFEDVSSALLYAKSRAFKGPLVAVAGKREGGKAYFVLSVDGSTVYRVFRGLRGEERRRGGGVEARREFIVVQSAQGLLPNNKTRWVWEHSLSIEIPAEESKDRDLPRYLDQKTQRGDPDVFYDTATKRLKRRGE